MDLVVYSQTCRTRAPDLLLEIDECLRRNLHHPGISSIVLFHESDAPPVPEGTVPVEVVRSVSQITYAGWFRWVQRQGSGIALLLNAGIYLDGVLEYLAASLNTPEAIPALSRHNRGNAGFHLKDFTHWRQYVWCVHAGIELPESPLYASSLPLCDSKICLIQGMIISVRLQCTTVETLRLRRRTMNRNAKEYQTIRPKNAKPGALGRHNVHPGKTLPRIHKL